MFNFIKNLFKKQINIECNDLYDLNHKIKLHIKEYNLCEKDFEFSIHNIEKTTKHPGLLLYVSYVGFNVLCKKTKINFYLDPLKITKQQLQFFNKNLYNMTLLFSISKYEELNDNLKNIIFNSNIDNFSKLKVFM